MRLMVCLVVLIAIGTAGCRWPWEPTYGPVTGVVRYPGGAPAWGARVSVDHGDTTFTGTDGRFYLSVPAGVETVTVRARDGFAPHTAYGETHSGLVRIVVRPEVLITTITLDHVDDI